MNLSTDRNGFTLLELIIVMVLIGILASVTISRYIDLRRNATDSAARGVLGALRSQNSLIYSQRIMRGTPGTYTMGVIANSIWNNTNRGMGFTWTANNRIFTLTIGGNSYRFTLNPYPNVPSALGRITAGGGTFARW